MKKKSLILIALLLTYAILPCVGEQSKSYLIFNGDTVKGSICMVDDSLQNDTMLIDAATWAMAKDTTHGWFERGDVRINTILDSVVYFTSMGPGKGGVYFTYGTQGCGDFVIGSELFKEFYPDKYDLAIQGPDCLKEGDTAVYSVYPVFTKNLGDFIGIDSYYWNINQKPYPPFIDTITYVSGDGSSITLIAGAVSGNDSVVVNFGRCNQEDVKRVVKHIGKAAPKPIVRDTCIPFDQTVLELNIYNEEYPDLIYTWDYSPKWDPAGYPSLDDNTQKRYHVELYPDTGSVGVITVTASYGDNDPCASAGRATFYLSRSWGKSAKITPQEVYAKNGGDFIKFQLSKDSVPDMSPTWELPTGWEQKSGTSNHQFTYFARPTNTTQYIDTIEVWANTCNSKDSCLAIVHMAPAKVDSISELTCLVPGNTYTFSVERLEVGPRPTGYTWYINGDSVYTSEEDTYTRSFTSNMTSIAVRSLGQNGWNADTTQIELSYSAIAPSQMSSDNTCLFAGREDTIKFTVHDRKPGYTYSWVYPSTWRDIEDEATDSTITLITDGRSGTQQVGVYAEYLAACGKSDTLYKEVFTDTITYYISHETQYGGALHIFTFRDSLTHTNVFTEDWEVDGSPRILSAPVHQIFLMQFEHPNLSHVKATTTREDGCPMPAEWFNVAAPIRHLNSFDTAQSYKTYFTLYPNPAQETITLNKEDDAPCHVIILGLDGRKLKTVEMKEKYLDVNISDIPIGSYYVLLTDGNKYSVEKLIKNY